MEDEAIEPCYEGVYRYLSGKPGPHLQKLVDKGVDYLWLREKGQFAARNPAAQKEAARSATNTTDGKGGTDLVGPVSASHDTREQEDLQA